MPVFCFCKEILEVQFIKTNKPEVNEEIRDKEVRLIGNDGEQLGIFSSKEALNMAFERGFDLIKVAPNAKPPVCKMQDYGKYKYEQAKRAKQAKKNSKTVKTKELRLSLKIEDHDLETKANKARDFINDGHKVKVSLRFKGREMGHTDLGYDVVNKFIEFVGDDCQVARKAKMEGRSLVAFIEPSRD